MVRACVALLALLLHVLVAAEATLELPDQIAPGVPTDGVVAVKNASSRVTSLSFPDLPGVSFSVSGGVMIQTTIINGAVTRAERIPIRMTAANAGTVTISGLAAVLDDGERITVPDRIVRITPGEAELTGEAVFSVRFADAEAWVGQPITLEYRAAFSAENLQMQQIGISPPTQATIIADPPRTQETALAADGSRWHVVVKRWTLAFTTPGVVELRGQQEYYRCQRDIFDRWVAVSGARRAPIKPATLTVREMPAGDRPADWTGAFAPMELTASVDRPRITAGEGARLTLVIRGQHARLLPRPPLPAIEGLRAYAHDDGTDADDHRSFTWDLVPAAPGQYSITGPSVSWFDAATQRFSRATANTLVLDVLPGRSTTLNVAGDTSRPAATSSAPSLALPAPMRGQGSIAPSPRLVLIVLDLALIAGLAWGWLVTRGPRIVRRQHRGRALAQAIAAGDLAAAALAVQQLHSALPDEADRLAARRIGEAIETARFGGTALAIDANDLARLRSIP